MIIADDVFDMNSGVSIPIIRRGVVLSRDLIRSLLNHQVGWVYVERPENYTGTAGETIELKHITKDISFEGRVSILCDIPRNIKIEAGESITVRGNVESGCFLTSKRGAVSLMGSVKGDAQDMVKITSQQHITAAMDIRGADMKASGEVTIKGEVIDSSIMAHGDIACESSVVRSQLYTQSKIKIRECGDPQNGPCLLVVKPNECLAYSQDLLKNDALILDLQKEMGVLQNIIDLIRKIGRGIEDLPPEKKMEMAQGVKRYKEVEKELASALAKKAELKNELAYLMMVKRIFVSDVIHPSVKVSIENCMYIITKIEHSLAFYVKDGKMSASSFTGAFGG